MAEVKYERIQAWVADKDALLDLARKESKKQNRRVTASEIIRDSLKKTHGI